MDPITGLAVAGLALQGAGILQQGAAASSAAEVNAEQARRDADAVDEKTKFDTARLRDRARLLRGANIAAVGASGTVLGTGSRAELFLRQAEDVALDQAAIRLQGSTAANRFRSEAAIQEFGGSQARTGAVLGAGRTFLSGAADADVFDELFAEDRIDDDLIGIPLE